MLKIFIVEDESVIREGLRDNIPWQDYGYELVGEASDGEMALPMIRSSCPDLLLTDIKMPFMDGLTLCHILRQELPELKMVVMSGYDDFEYARRAISEGIVRYMLKPITKRGIKQLLDEIRDTIEAERKTRSSQENFRRENRDYRRLKRREYFERLFSSRLSMEDMYEEAARLSINISGPCYSLILFSISEQGEEAFCGSEEFLSLEGELIGYFMRFPEYILFKWNFDSYCVVIRGEAETVELYLQRGMDKIAELCSGVTGISWHAAAGGISGRFSALSDVFRKLNRVFSVRFWHTEQHILTEELLNTGNVPGSDKNACGSEYASEAINEGGGLLDRVLSYIEEHYTEEGMSLGAVADSCGVSSSYLSTAFKRELGRSFVEYVTDKRMELAKRLLRREGLHTSECAARVGYRDHNYFSFVFKKTQGCSAREYRERLEGKSPADIGG